MLSKLPFGIEKLNIKDDGKYQLMQGIAYFELKQYANAKNSFVKASITKKYKDSGWWRNTRYK